MAWNRWMPGYGWDEYDRFARENGLDEQTDASNLAQYFTRAKTCTPSSRMFGVEVETLFVKADSAEPISFDQSQAMMRAMSQLPGWKIQEESNGVVVEVGNGQFSLMYELGWSNLELNTPPARIEEYKGLLKETYQVLGQLKQAGTNVGAKALTKHYDGLTDANTLLMPDKRDQIWLELDGEILQSLGHIACVQYTIDVTSIEEAFDFVQVLQPLRNANGWPATESEQIWRSYIDKSKAGYETNRYGATPTCFDKYWRELLRKKVFMDRKNSQPARRIPALSVATEPPRDMDLFLRSVWWWERLRVRDGKLMLEIRDIPRQGDDMIAKNWQLIKNRLAL